MSYAALLDQWEGGAEGDEKEVGRMSCAGCGAAIYLMIVQSLLWKHWPYILINIYKYFAAGKIYWCNKTFKYCPDS